MHFISMFGLLQKRSSDDDEDEGEFKLPAALEKVLALKEMRAQEVGVRPEDMDKMDQGMVVEECPVYIVLLWCLLSLTAYCIVIDILITFPF